MAIFRYRVKKGLEGIIEGRLEAQSEKEAIEELSQMGYIPVRIEEEVRTVEPVSRSPGKLRGRIRSREITVFSRQLASLFKSGVPILPALDIIAEQSENRNLKDALYSIRNAVKEGASLSSALGKYPNVFPPLYLAIIHTGEDSGALPAALLRISDYRAKQEEMISRFRMAMAYPILMALVGLGTVIFMLTYVMPRLMGIFANIGEKLPLPTRILISISQDIRSYWFWIIIILAAVFWVGRQQAKTKAGKISLSIFKLHLPVFGKFILKAELSRFSRTLEMLIKNGIPILKAIEISIPVVENEVIRNKIRLSCKELEQGGSFGKSLRGSKWFPVFMSNLISVGEESGRLDEALGEVANSYERDTDETIRVMASLLEPLMILVMGLIVGFIVVAMLLPIFEINIMAK